MRRILCLFVFLAAAIIIGGACLFTWGYYEYQKPGPLEKPTLIIISRGESVNEIAAKLFFEGATRSSHTLAIGTRLLKVDANLKAGEYILQPGMSAKEIVDLLRTGKVYQRQFTIPEGLTSWQIVQLLNGTEGLGGEIITTPKEGSLLPETYNFVHGDTGQDKITQMQEAMKQTLDEIWLNKSKDAPLLSKAEAVILASIVEKETALASERRRIAGVFHNRLKKGMKLQTDPTVIYALTNGKIKDNGQGPLGRRLLTKDLQFESPYNTYKYPGLPPGPIANPGRASLEAVFNPEQHGYYYFVADGTGGHVFAKTLGEHNNNVAKWRKIRKKKK